MAWPLSISPVLWGDTLSALCAVAKNWLSFSSFLPQDLCTCVFLFLEGPFNLLTCVIYQIFIDHTETENKQTNKHNKKISGSDKHYDENKARQWLGGYSRLFDQGRPCQGGDI